MTDHRAAGFLDALRSLSETLKVLGSPAMVIGGIAVIAHGVPRSTIDIDAAVLADALDLDRLAEVCASHGIRARIPDALTFAGIHQVYLARHDASGVPIDIALAWLPFEREAIERSTMAEYETVRVRIPRPDDLLIYKLVASRPRDLGDAEQLLLLHGRTMDLARVRRVIRELARALEDPDRPAALEHLIQKAGLV